MNVVSYSKKEISELKKGDTVYLKVVIRQGWGEYRHSFFKKKIVKSISPKGNSLKTESGEVIDLRTTNIYHESEEVHKENVLAKNFVTISDIKYDLSKKDATSIPDEYLQKVRDAYQALADIYDEIEKAKG